MSVRFQQTGEKRGQGLTNLVAVLEEEEIVRIGSVWQDGFDTVQIAVPHGEAGPFGVFAGVTGLGFAVMAILGVAWEQLGVLRTAWCDTDADLDSHQGCQEEDQSRSKGRERHVATRRRVRSKRCANGSRIKETVPSL